LTLAEQGNFDVLVHGANCFTTMGSGIAGQIKSKYMSVYLADCKTRKGDYNKLGCYSIAEVTSKLNPKFKFTVVNAYTQYTFSRGEDVFEYNAFSVILQKLSKQFKGLRVGFPNIGSGLAGGNKEVITNMIQQFSNTFELSGGSVTIVEYDGV